MSASPTIDRPPPPTRMPSAITRAGRWARRPLSRRNSLYALAAALLVILNLADVAITREALAHGASELNPIARFFVEHAPIAYTLKLGVPVMVLLLAASRRAQDRLSEAHIAAIWTIVGIYLMTVFINVVTLLHYA